MEPSYEPNQSKMIELRLPKLLIGRLNQSVEIESAVLIDKRTQYQSKL